MKTIRRLASVAGILGLASLGGPLHAEHPCTSPLVLDLDGDGRILTSGVEYPVEFDINGDGLLETIGWTALETQDGYLWLDLDQDGTVNDGGELFGSSTRLPSGEFADNGFQALAVYDRAEFGGDGDGVISPRDLIWRRLRLWIDANHDGKSQRPEIRTLGAHGVVAVSLEYREVNQLDGHLNLHALSGSFFKRGRVLNGIHLQERLVEDIFFVVVDH